MSSPDPIDVWLIEDNASFRRTLRRALDETEGLRCGRELGSCEAAFEALAAGAAPDVVLLDVGLPGMSGIEALPRFEELAPTAKVIVLTVYEDDDKILSVGRDPGAGVERRRGSRA
jgi:DNA-binding NarL/FixJ family response regulator